MRGIAILIVPASAFATWLLSGVSVVDVARFVAFEGLYVLLPGCMLFALLSRPSGGWLRILAIGWPLGYAIEMGWFAATAALDQREIFRFLPLIAATTMGTCLIIIRGRPVLKLPQRTTRSRTDYATGRSHSLATLTVAVVVSVALLILALEIFAPFPLPEHARSVAYPPTSVFSISLAAEARHHWPITEPYVAGQPLRYYTGFFVHAAAVNQATGISLAVVILRLFPTMIVIVVALQLSLLGRELRGSPWTGCVAVILFFLGAVSVDITRFAAFGTAPFNLLTASQTYAFGISFFLGLLALVQRQLAIEKNVDIRRPTSSAWRRRVGASGSLVMFGILALAAGAVKTLAAVDLLAGMGLLWLWSVAVARRGPLLSRYLGLLAICTSLIYYFMLTGGYAVRIRPLAFIYSTVFVSLYPARSIVGWGLLVCAAAFACFCLLVPVLGVAWLLRKPEQHALFIAFCVAVFVASAGAYVVVEAPGHAQFEFINYGSIGLIPLAALGLTRLWTETPKNAKKRLVQACFVTLTLSLTIAVSSQVLTVTEALPRSARTGWTVWYIGAYGLVASAIAVMAVRLERYFMPVIQSRLSRIIACCIPLVVMLGFVRPVGAVDVDVWAAIFGKQVQLNSSDDQGLTAPLYRGLIWVRRNTTSCDVLAVSNHSVVASEIDAQYFYYSALAERRVFLEAWEFTRGGQYGGQPFPTRLALNRAATLHGNLSALRELAGKGVSYVLIDKSHGGGAPEPANVGRLMFSDSALDVYRLVMPPALGRRRPRCGMLTDL